MMVEITSIDSNTLLSINLDEIASIENRNDGTSFVNVWGVLYHVNTKEFEIAAHAARFGRKLHVVKVEPNE